MHHLSLRTIGAFARRALLPGLFLLAIPACTQSPPDETPGGAPEPPAITDRDWELSAFGDSVEPRGAGGRPVTLRIDTGASRAVGFAGCNSYSAVYALRGDSLTFGPAIATKMACTEGMDLESQYLASLSSFRTFEASDSTLVLRDASGPLAYFRRAAP